MAFNMPSFGMMLVRLSHWKHTKRKRVGTFKELSHFIMCDCHIVVIILCKSSHHKNKYQAIMKYFLLLCTPLPEGVPGVE
jgi:hypothetical protein